MTESQSQDPLLAFTAESAPAVDPRIGMILHDRYRIVRKLGAGGMGVVYEGEHMLIKRRVAIKCLHPQFAEDADALGRFLREAQAATSIGNEHIIDVLDLGRFPDGSAFMVLEFLDGRSLTTDFQESGPLPLGRLVHIVDQICDALGAAHAKGVIHRDLKPDNIFLLRQKNNPDFVKVLDFGISKILGDDAAGAVKTRTGLVMGTLHFMPPEQLRADRDMDHRIDIYALGVIMYRALTGRFPFEDDAVPMLAMKIVSWPAPSVRILRPDLPAAFDGVLQSVLAKSMHDRPADCQALQSALAPFASVFDAPQILAPSVGLTQKTVGFEGPPGAQLTPIFGTPVEFSHPPPSAIPSVPEASPVRSSGSTSKGWIVACVIGLLALLTAAAFGLRAPSHRGEPERPVAPQVRVEPPQPVQPPTPLAAPAAPAAPVAMIPTPPTPAASVHVQIQTDPDSAELFLDNGRISNPFDGELPQSADPRRLEARHRGYATVVQDLVLNVPQTVRVRLHRGGGVDDRRRTPQAPAPAPTAEANARTPAAQEAHPNAAPTPTPARPPGPSIVAPPTPQNIMANPF